MSNEYGKNFRGDLSRLFAELSSQLRIPRATVHDVLSTRLKMGAHEIQLFQTLTRKDRNSRNQFASRNEKEETYPQELCLSDEAAFHVRGTVNRYRCRVWRSENPHDFTERERDSQKVNV
jgi:hypothetical protein